ncbi:MULTISPECIES: energy-coupling factor transporter transmembrane component T [Vagococcus]|nr:MULTISPECIES: energy-coupling factor transporter transmembrane component T [Vagococcus]HCM89403.1 energy-coupling factor transporter transmembrane protein EcfT [Vagococcus sp.]
MDTKKTLETIHPLTKASVLTFLLFLINLFPTKETIISLSLFFIFLFLFTSNKIALIKKITLTNLFLFLPMFLMQLLFKPGKDIIFSWFIIRISTESIAFAVSLFIRLCIISSFILLFFHITKVKDFTISLEEIGLSKSVTYILLATMMLVPQIIQRSKVIMQAQKIRGIEMNGHLLTRVKAFIPIITPLILSSLMATEEQALTLEARGFFSENKRVYLHSKKKNTFDNWIIFLSLFASGFLLIFKVVLKWLI